MFHDAATFGTRRRTVLSQKLLYHATSVESRLAVQTGNKPRRSVQFADVLASRELMQSIDVLRDDSPQFSRLFPLCQDVMSNVRLSIGEVTMRDCFLPPVLLPSRGTTHEVFEINRLICRPDSTGRTKIRDAALRADARARKRDGAGGFGQPLGDDSA